MSELKDKRGLRSTKRADVAILCLVVLAALNIGVAGFVVGVVVTAMP